MIRRLVLDASAALEAVLPGPQADAVLDLVEETSVVLVPSIFHAEVANALWKYVRAGQLEPHRAADLLDSAGLLADRTVPDAELVQEALAGAAAADHPVYDLLYAVLARRFGATVCTLDGRLTALLEELKIDGVLLRR